MIRGLHLPSLRISRNTEILAVGLSLLAILAATYYEIVWMFWLPYDGDMWTQYFPAKWFSYQYLKQGILPLWTPNLMLGFPVFAEAQAGMLYPLSLPFYFLPTTTAFSVTVILRPLLAGVFTFLYVRRISGNSVGAALSAICFACGGYMTAQMRHENVGNAIIWLPVILLFIDRWLEDLDRKYLALAALCLGVSFLAGYFYVSFFILLVSCAYYLFKAYPSISDPRQITAYLPCILGLATFCLIGIGIAGVQIVPNYELSLESIRGSGLDYQTSTQVSLPPFQLITMVFPKFFGFPPDRTLWGMWKDNNIDLVSYLGVIPFLTIIAGLVIRRDRLTWFFAGLLLTSLLLAFGQFSPLWYLINKLPVFSMMRNPARFLSIASFAGAVMAGLGVTALMSSTDEKRRFHYRRLLLVLTAVLVTASLISGFVVAQLKELILSTGKWFVDSFIYQQSTHTAERAHYYSVLSDTYAQFQEIATITHPYIYQPVIFLVLGGTIVFFLARTKTGVLGLSLAALLVTGIDLGMSSRGYNTLLPAEAYDRKEYYIEVMEQDTGLFRYCFAPLWQSMRNYDAFRFDESYLQGHSPLRLQRQQDVTETLRPLMEGLTEGPAPGLANMLNIKYIVTGDSLDSSHFESRFDEGAKVYENRTVLPRAFMVNSATVLDTEQEVLAAMEDPAFDPLESLLFDRSQEVNEVRADTIGTQLAEITRYSIHNITVSTQSSGGFLFLSDMHYPGWKAFVDGNETPILRANYAFRAVVVPSGPHIVEFVFDSGSFKSGLVVSLASLAGVGMLFLQGIRMRRRV